MENYISTSGKHPGVTGYQAGDDYILVQFKEHEVYKYTYRSAGEYAVQTMKDLARAQHGLSTFIAQHQPAYE